MAKLRLAGVLTAIALLVGLLGSAVTVSAQGVTVITGEVTLSGTAAPMGTQVRVVDADGQCGGFDDDGPQRFRGERVPDRHQSYVGRPARGRDG